jgi:hypothetical protein
VLRFTGVFAVGWQVVCIGRLHPRLLHRADHHLYDLAEEGTARGQPGQNLVAGFVLCAMSLFFYLFSLQVQVPTIMFLAIACAIVNSVVLLSGFRL